MERVIHFSNPLLDNCVFLYATVHLLFCPCLLSACVLIMGNAATKVNERRSSNVKREGIDT